MADPESSTSLKSPAFQFYPKDFLTDENVCLMSMQDRGIYITLMCKCWIEGTLPVDQALLARVAGVPSSVFRRSWTMMQQCFRPDPTNPARLIHPRLQRERDKQHTFKQRQSDNGRRGGRPPKATQKLESQSQNNPSLSAPGFPEKSSSSASSSSSADSSQTYTRVREGVDNTTAERAGNFIERYQALHVRLRKGAHYVGRPALDFQEALQLVGVYDDTRLDKLAYVWLNTDHDFAQNGTRTLAKFRSMVSWCEEQLIEFEQQHGQLQVTV